jgi:hypothetical protein
MCDEIEKKNQIKEINIGIVCLLHKRAMHAIPSSFRCSAVRLTTIVLIFMAWMFLFMFLYSDQCVCRLDDPCCWLIHHPSRRVCFVNDGSVLLPASLLQSKLRRVGCLTLAAARLRLSSKNPPVAWRR